jgi:hypothetical protein
VIVQNPIDPAPVLDWYVTLATPLALVTTGFAVVKVPQVGPPLVVNVTESPFTGTPVTPLVTVAVMADVLLPFA